MARTKKSGSQLCCQTMQQLSLFAPPTKRELCQLEAWQGRSASQKQLQKFGSYIPGSFAQKRHHKLVADLKAAGFVKVRLRVAVNDLGRAVGEDHANAKYLEQDVEAAKRLRAEGYTWARIAEMLDMPVRTVRSYVDGSRRSQSIADFKVVKRWIKS